jgi:DNA-binding transcriptional MerR regulator
MNKRHFTVKELADQVGLSTSAIRAWERRFSLFSPERTAAGHRVYSLDDLKLLWYVQHLQSQQRDLKEISDLGRETLLSQAREFFAANAPSLREDQCSYSSRLLQAAENRDLPKIAELVDHLRAVAVSSIDFAETILCILKTLDSGSSPFPALAKNFLAERVQAHLIAPLLQQKTAPAASSALCVNLGERPGINLLRTAHYLRTWGFQPLLMQEKVDPYLLHDLVIRGGVEFLCIGLDQNIAARSQVLDSLARDVAPYALTCIVHANTQDPPSDVRNLPEAKYLYFVNSMLEFEVLAETRLKDKRQPALVLQEFLATWRSS